MPEGAGSVRRGLRGGRSGRRYARRVCCRTDAEVQVLRTLLGSLLPAVLVLGLVLVAPTTAVAQDACPPAGGVDDDPPISRVPTQETDPEWEREVSAARLDPDSPDAHDVVFSGGGWGHGVGLSQFAAQGAATLGCSADTIIQTHFPGTTLEDRPSRNPLRLKLWTTGEAGLNSVWASDAIVWEQCQQADSGAITSCSKLADQPANTSVRATLTGSGWRLQGGGLDVTADSRTYTLLRARHDGTLVRVRQGGDATSTSGLAVRYGHLELDYTGQNGGRLFATQVIDRNDRASGLSPMETYLLGLAEVPFSWRPAALQAQVVAARSYAEATARIRQSYTDAQRIDILDCRCDLRVDTGDQVWAGATKELAEPSYYPNWVDAVRATAGRYVIRNGNVLTTFYSSSFGGMSRAGFGNGTTASDANYTSVDVSRWEKVFNDGNGHSRYRWSQGFSRAELQRAFGIDDIDGIRIVDTDTAGYPMPRSIEVTDGQGNTRLLDPYQQVRSRLGLYSPRFTLQVVTDLADDDQIPVSRLQGEHRVATAIRLSEAGWAGSDTVVLARQDVAADALTGSALAGMYDAPLLLTAKDRLEELVGLEVQRLGATRVILLGGPAALSKQVERDLGSLGITTIERVQGQDRHGTAANVATRVARGEETSAYLVRLAAPNPAIGWVDALSVAGVAARRAGSAAAWPILGTDATLPAATRTAIEEQGITRVVPVGGPNTIPEAVLDELRALDVEVGERLAGADRYGTSRAVTATDTPPNESLVIATGENFPDGLAAGPFAARTGASLLLVPRTASPAPVWDEGGHRDLVASLGWTEPRLVAVGGPAAIENAVISRMATYLENARPDS